MLKGICVRTDLPSYPLNLSMTTLLYTIINILCINRKCFMPMRWGGDPIYTFPLKQIIILCLSIGHPPNINPYSCLTIVTRRAKVYIGAVEWWSI